MNSAVSKSVDVLLVADTSKTSFKRTHIVLMKVKDITHFNGELKEASSVVGY